MADIGTISAVLSSVKTATDIAKIIKNSDVSLDAAETKLKVAELISALADVKLELAEVQDALREKDLEISSLKERFREKQSMNFDGKLYWIEGDETPLCQVCYETDLKLHHLTYKPGGQGFHSYHSCKVCKNSFD
jgi:hypothetical protein